MLRRLVDKGGVSKASILEARVPSRHTRCRQRTTRGMRTTVLGPVVTSRILPKDRQVEDTRMVRVMIKDRDRATVVDDSGVLGVETVDGEGSDNGSRYDTREVQL
jgi:hypothetical protein